MDGFVVEEIFLCIKIKERMKFEGIQVLYSL